MPTAEAKATKMLIHGNVFVCFFIAIRFQRGYSLIRINANTA